MIAASSHAPGIHDLPRSPSALPAVLRRGLAGLAARLGMTGYRPERHYMRGGSTPGSRSLAAAHARIAGRR
ncbi:hypothetical protein [Roseicella aquatilis]|uniref:Uncharacterized protein n=1 Tax=Roseicella aquatilis TaxID=2527868 RepID=A0A4R4D5M8_9PROT|nr:hypothetical protein [Roseicella aquatilis]TCZ55408.1 hypothetical protein EXY23_21590 [Roseicella aquatilis]